MPRSEPNLQLVAPPGLTLSYPGFVLDGVAGGSLPGPTNPSLITDERGGGYLLMHHMSAFANNGPRRGTHDVVLDGQPDAAVPFDFTGIAPEHRAMLAGGVSSVPVLPGHNPLLFQLAGVGVTDDTNDSWMAALVPNIHGNHRVIVPNPEPGPPSPFYTVTHPSGSFSIGTPGHYALLLCATADTPTPITGATLLCLLDGAPLATFAHTFNRGNDPHAFCPFPLAGQALSAGGHVLTLKSPNDLNNEAQPGPWRAFAFYDPDDDIITDYSSNVPHPGTFVLTINVPVTQTYLVLAGFTAYQAAGGGRNIGLNFGTFGGTSSTVATRINYVNTANVHTWMSAMFVGTVQPAAGNHDFWFTDAFTSTFSLTTDANDRSFLMMIPVPYLG